jgi:hypothetical protein
MMKLRNKEQAMRNYYKVQRRQLEIDEANAPRRWSSREKEVELNALTKAREVELKQRQVELKLLSKKTFIMTASFTTMRQIDLIWSMEVSTSLANASTSPADYYRPQLRVGSKAVP